MKFTSFKEFRQYTGVKIEDVSEFLRVDLTKTLRELAGGLFRLKLTENFRSFKVEVSIPAASELAIRNELRDVVPSERLIVRADSNTICDGDTAWNQNFVYLKNTGASAATATVIFLE